MIGEGGLQQCVDALVGLEVVEGGWGTVLDPAGRSPSLSDGSVPAK